MRKTGIAIVCCLACLAAAPASSPTTAPQFPAMQKRLAELAAAVEALTAKLESLQAENAALRAKLAAADVAVPAKVADTHSRAKKIHDVAMDGRTLFRGMDPDTLTNLIGKPDENRRDAGGWVRQWVAGDYSLSIFVSDGVVKDFTESGPIPK